MGYGKTLHTLPDTLEVMLTYGVWAALRQQLGYRQSEMSAATM